jgi:hypothetical protein
MWPQYLMVVGGILFFVGLVAFLQKNVNPPEPAGNVTAKPLEPNSQRTQEISEGINQISPIVEALKNSQRALAESEQTKNLLGRVTAQFDQLESGIAVQEQFTGTKRTEERLAAAEHVIKELRAILGDVRTQKTSQGEILLIKTAPNTFRVTFAVPMRIKPQLNFQGLPLGATPNVVEHSALGFTVVFTPPSIPVEQFGFSASAEL